ncbi:MAG TPA: cell division protein FtsB [Psychromonas hadalis]|nr:cell division protein FtsB [Psychromonas hadalis]
MRVFIVFLVTLLGLQQYHLWFGKNGLQDHEVLVNAVALSVKNNALLIKRNQKMYAEIKELKRGDDAVEERARNELGLIKEGETFFRITAKKG